MKFMCPICGFDNLDEPAYSEVGDCSSFDICPVCGVEFGLEEVEAGNIKKINYPKISTVTIPILMSWWKLIREQWIKEGCPWRSTVLSKPENWDPQHQLKNVDIFLNRYAKTGKLDFSISSQK